MLEDAVKDCLIAGIIEKSGAEPETKEELIEYFVTLKGGVRVVRCKDCKHGRSPICIGYFGVYVACHLTEHRLLMKSSDFCSYGERRTE